MGFFKSKVKAGPSAAQIRAEEQAKIKAENLQAIQQQESLRQRLRTRTLAPEDEEIERKRLLGE